MRNEKKFLNSNEKKVDVNEKRVLNSITKVVIIVFVILICLGIFIIPKFESFFKKDVEENGINENKSDVLNENYETLEDGTKVNTSEDIENYEFVLNGIRFSNIKVTEKDGLTDLKIDYENTLDSDVEGFGIKINFYNEKDEVVYYYSVGLPETIKSGEKDKIYSSILEEYAGIKYIKMEIDSEL